jgi:hypothetical protein
MRAAHCSPIPGPGRGPGIGERLAMLTLPEVEQAVGDLAGIAG